MVGYSINTAKPVWPVGDHFNEVPLYMKEGQVRILHVGQNQHDGLS